MSIFEKDLKHLKPIEIEAADELSKILPKGLTGPLEVRRPLTAVIDERKKTKALKKKVRALKKAHSVLEEESCRIYEAAYPLVFAVEDVAAKTPFSGDREAELAVRSATAAATKLLTFLQERAARTMKENGDLLLKVHKEAPRENPDS